MGQLQAIVGGAAAATSAPLTISASAAGSGLVYAIWLSSSTAPTTLTDSAGGSLAGAQWTLRQSTGAWFIYDRLSNPGGITSVTANFGSTTYLAILIERDDLVSFDKTGYTDSGGTVTSWSSASTGTLSFANEVCIGLAATFTGSNQSPAASGAWSAGTGTGITAGAWTGTSGDQAFYESQVVAATTALQATGTWGTASYTYATIVTYRQTVAGGGAAKQNRLSIGIGIGI